MKLQDYTAIVRKLIELGYSSEIEWQRTLQPCDHYHDFIMQTIWVILNSGMKNQIASMIHDRIIKAWHEGKETSTAFGHKGKVKAIDYIRWNGHDLFEKYKQAEDKIEFLKSLPFIGNITCWHLAKNLGHDCVKPDRHLVRVASQYNKTPDELCEQISKESGDKKCVVDIIIWRACNLNLL
jgi:hypothetical protein